LKLKLDDNDNAAAFFHKNYIYEKRGKVAYLVSESAGQENIQHERYGLSTYTS